jgi:hypothetical protein
MTRTQERANISKDVRRDLWIAAAGRCEFRGCNKPVDRDFLTKGRCNVGEYAHIVADSPDGARGIPGESERLAKDPGNLMLACSVATVASTATARTTSSRQSSCAP